MGRSMMHYKEVWSAQNNAHAPEKQLLNGLQVCVQMQEYCSTKQEKMHSSKTKLSALEKVWNDTVLLV